MVSSSSISTSGFGSVYPLRPSRPLSRIRLKGICNHLHKGVEFFSGALLRHCHEHRPDPKVEPAYDPGLQQCLVGPWDIRQLHGELPKERRIRIPKPKTRSLKPLCQIMGLRDGEFGHFAQSLWSHQGRVDGRGQGRERLVGTDVGVRPRTPDVLLAAPQGEDVGQLSVFVYGLSRDTSRKLADEILPGRHVACVRATEHERHPERLGLANGHVCPEVPWGFEYGEGNRLTHRNAERVHIVRRLRGGPYVLDDPEVVWTLHEDPRDVIGEIGELRGAVFEREIHNFDAVGPYDLAVAGVEASGGCDFGITLRQPCRHEGCFHDGVRAVVDGGVGDPESCQLGDHGLELEDRLQGALADLRLVRSVRGQELAARDDGTNGGGYDPIVGPGTEEDREPPDVLLRQGIYLSQRLVLREGRWKIEISFVPRVDVGEEVVYGLDPDGAQHLLYIDLCVRCESRHVPIPPVSGERCSFRPVPNLRVLPRRRRSVPDSPGRPPARGPFA